MARETMDTTIATKQFREAANALVETIERSAGDAVLQRAEIVGELAAAIIRVAHDEGGALWRICDAAGLLSKLVPGDCLGQPGNPTGLGYSIKHA